MCRKNLHPRSMTERLFQSGPPPRSKRQVHWTADINVEKRGQTDKTTFADCAIFVKLRHTRLVNNWNWPTPPPTLLLGSFSLPLSPHLTLNLKNRYVMADEFRQRHSPVSHSPKRAVVSVPVEKCWWKINETTCSGNNSKSDGDGWWGTNDDGAPAEHRTPPFCLWGYYNEEEKKKKKKKKENSFNSFNNTQRQKNVQITQTSKVTTKSLIKLLSISIQRNHSNSLKQKKTRRIIFLPKIKKIQTKTKKILQHF